jgi:GT2 family glycosyltransferase
MTLGIVILNFLAYQDTIDCVQSIKKQTFQDYKVVIVDNASTNESFEALNDVYKTDEKITVMRTEANIGFARGNNVGIAYLKKLGVYNILVINGDTVLTQPFYLERLASLDLSDKVGMIGTQIISRDGQNQNTVPVHLTNKKALRKNKTELFFMKIICKINIYSLLKKISQKGIKKHKNAPKSEKIVEKLLDPNREMLHGAAIFFTENYLKNYIGFYPETFLYSEEEFLAFICRTLGYQQLYVEGLEIYHKEDASSNLLMDNNQKKSVLFKIAIIKKNIALMDKALRMSPDELKQRMSE